MAQYPPASPRVTLLLSGRVHAASTWTCAWTTSSAFRRVDSKTSPEAAVPIRHGGVLNVRSTAQMVSFILSKSVSTAGSADGSNSLLIPEVQLIPAVELVFFVVKMLAIMPCTVAARSTLTMTPVPTAPEEAKLPSTSKPDS